MEELPFQLPSDSDDEACAAEISRASPTPAKFQALVRTSDWFMHAETDASADSQEVLRYRAALLFAQGKYSECYDLALHLQEHREAHKKQQQRENLDYLARCAARLRQWDAALEHAAERVKSDTDNDVSGHLLLASLCFDTGDLPRAIRNFQYVLKVHPTAAREWGQLAQCYLRQHQAAPNELLRLYACSALLRAVGLAQLLAKVSAGVVPKVHLDDCARFERLLAQASQGQELNLRTLCDAIRPLADEPEQPAPCHCKEEPGREHQLHFEYSFFATYVPLPSDDGDVEALPPEDKGDR
eukprot:m.149493 g.149493  ORF g.149493 m.149493 type:complete len:299 (-) comp20633_c1_seq5:46-942(-)